MRFEMRSISETESGSASAPIVTSRPSGRNPCMQSTIDLVEFEVLRITSAPPAAPLAPFAAAAGGLNASGTHTVAYLSRGDVGSHRNDLADRLVAEDSGEWSRQMSERLMDVGVADAAGMHLHEHLIRSGLRLRNVFDLPRTAHSGNDGGLHNTSS